MTNTTNLMQGYHKIPNSVKLLWFLNDQESLHDFTLLDILLFLEVLLIRLLIIYVYMVKFVN
jgi:hypothetical protein